MTSGLARLVAVTSLVILGSALVATDWFRARETQSLRPCFRLRELVAGHKRESSAIELSSLQSPWICDAFGHVLSLGRCRRTESPRSRSERSPPV